jgi:hypothetical protein
MRTKHNTSVPQHIRQLAARLDDDRYALPARLCAMLTDRENDQREAPSHVIARTAVRLSGRL